MRFPVFGAAGKWWLPLLILAACSVLASCSLTGQQIGDWSYVVSSAFGALAGVLGARVRVHDVCERCARKGAKRGRPRKAKAEASGPRLPFGEEKTTQR